jgi:hypothetical protein
MVCRHFEVLDCLSFSSTGIWSDTFVVLSPKLQIMSEKILTAIKGKKEAFHLWKTNGRPKNSDNTYTINKKNTVFWLLSIYS